MREEHFPFFTNSTQTLCLSINALFFIAPRITAIASTGVLFLFISYCSLNYC